MRSRTPIAVTALLALALTGCADDANQAGTAPSTSAAAPASTSVSPSADPSTGSSQSTTDALLIFTRQGGLAGTNDRLVVRPDGGWTLTAKAGTKEGKLTPAQLTTLKGTLEQVGFSKLPTAAGSTNVADGYTYTITYGGKEVQVKDGAVPAALQPVITTLNGLLS
ncbi:hypothetical protein [Dactylosporangium sp. NPDC050588]|uniref:hypothetical protein n=1 Tax=Dactylosporangium sp. NPDC050588 TaxID=3157211 RepID=UPI003408A04A